MATDLEQRLREALAEDAHRARLVNPDQPRIPDPRPLPAEQRRSGPPRWLVAVAAVAVIVTLVGALVVLNDDPAVDTVPATEPPPTPMADVTQPELATGTYLVDPDDDGDTTLAVTFDIAAEGWEAWIGASKPYERGNLGVSITTVTNVTRDACLDPEPAYPAVGSTVDDLATALSQLAPFEVTAAPSDVTFGGFPGKHLELTVPALDVSGPSGDRRFTDCVEGHLNSWIAPDLGGPFWGYNADPGSTEEIWILEVGDTRLMISALRSSAAPAEDLVELQAVLDSIQIMP
jgi:hypothetical protein